MAKLLDAYAAEPGAAPVEVLLSESQPQLLLRDGQADVALLHEPWDSTAGFDTEALHSDNQTLIMLSRGCAHGPGPGQAVVVLQPFLNTPGAGPGRLRRHGSTPDHAE